MKKYSPADPEYRKDAPFLGPGTTVEFKTGELIDDGWNIDHYRESGGANVPYDPTPVYLFPTTALYIYQSANDSVRIGPKTIVEGDTLTVHADGTTTP